MKKECINCTHSFYSDFYLECSLYSRINNNNACESWLDKNNVPHTCEFCKLYNSLNCPYSGCDNSKGDCDEWRKKN